MNSVINTSHPRDARTPDRSFQDYPQSRYSTPIHDDDFAALDQSSDYSQLSHDGSFVSSMESKHQPTSRHAWFLHLFQGHYSSDREVRSIPYGALSGGLSYGVRNDP